MREQVFKPCLLIVVMFALISCGGDAATSIGPMPNSLQAVGKCIDRNIDRWSITPPSVVTSACIDRHERRVLKPTSNLTNCDDRVLLTVASHQGRRRLGLHLYPGCLFPSNKLVTAVEVAFSLVTAGGASKTFYRKEVHLLDERLRPEALGLEPLPDGPFGFGWYEMDYAWNNPLADEVRTAAISEAANGQLVRCEVSSPPCLEMEIVSASYLHLLGAEPAPEGISEDEGNYGDMKQELDIFFSGPESPGR